MTPEQHIETAKVPVRGTQSMVGTLSRCWQQPSVTGLEVLWRWVFGVPTLALVGTQLRRILATHTDGTFDLSRLGLDRAFMADPVGSAAADPLGVSAKIAEAVGILLPDVLHVALWLVPTLMVLWVLISSVGRTILLRRMDVQLHTRLGTMMALQALRMVAMVAIFGFWLGCLKWVARVAIAAPIAAGQEPNLVLYSAMMIVATLALFSGWAAVSWVLAVAPLAAMLRNTGVVESMKAAFRLGGLKGKLIEVNLVLGIVKIGLIMVAGGDAPLLHRLGLLSRRPAASLPGAMASVRELAIFLVACLEFCISRSESACWLVRRAYVVRNLRSWIPDPDRRGGLPRPPDAHSPELHRRRGHHPGGQGNWHRRAEHAPARPQLEPSHIPARLTSPRTAQSGRYLLGFTLGMWTLRRSSFWILAPNTRS